VDGPLNPIPGVADLNECSEPEMNDCSENAKCINQVTILPKLTNVSLQILVIAIILKLAILHICNFLTLVVFVWTSFSLSKTSELKGKNSFGIHEGRYKP
jgi:hypothetical protein